MAYLTIYGNWLPYSTCKDPRGFISQRFGAGHSGIDSVCNLWSAPVCAIFDGIVTDVSYSPGNGWTVTYESTNGRIRVRHCHLQKEISVQTGSAVTRNSTILAFEGNTGTNSKGKHLHTSLWIDGCLVDPEEYLAGKKPLPTGASAAVKSSDGWRIRRVTRDDLNLRSGAGVEHPSLGKLQRGSYFFCEEGSECVVNGAIWAKVTAVLTNGKAYRGWSNIGDTWSQGIAKGE